MSMINPRRGQNSSGNDPKLPRAPTVPVPQPLERIYSEEVLNFLEQNANNKRLIAQLEGERDDWRRKSIGADEDNRRLQMRLDRDEQAHVVEIAKLTAQRDGKIDELTQQRDQYKLKLAQFETKIVMIGEALIKLASTTSETVSKLLDEIRAEHGRPDATGIAGLAAVAEAVAAEDPTAPKIESAVQ